MGQLNKVGEGTQAVKGRNTGSINLLKKKSLKSEKSMYHMYTHKLCWLKNMVLVPPQ